MQHSFRARFRLLLAGAVCLAGLWYFIPLGRNRPLESDGTLFPRDIDPPLSSKTEMEIGALEESVRQNPPNAATQTRLGQAYLQKARASSDPIFLTKAETLFKKALELDGRN